MRLPKRCLVFDSEARSENRNTYTVIYCERRVLLYTRHVVPVEADVKPDTTVDGCGIVDPCPVPRITSMIIVGAGVVGLLLRRRNIHSELNFSFSPI